MPPQSHRRPHVTGPDRNQKKDYAPTQPSAGARQRKLDLAAATAQKKQAQTKFYRELEKYMRSNGRQATGEQVLHAAEQIWHANEVVRKLQPIRQPRESAIPRDKALPRPQPKRVSRVISGGLPGQQRRK